MKTVIANPSLAQTLHDMAVANPLEGFLLAVIALAGFCALTNELF